MNTLLTCDDFFETLTAGPIVKGSADAAAAQDHIASCRPCRELAEAMRPASHLIHEAMPLELRAGLPTYLADDAAVSNVMSRIATLPTLRTGRRDFRSTVIGLGVAAGIMLLLLWRPLPPNNAVLTSNVSLDRLHLPHSCFQFASPEAKGVHRNATAETGTPRSSIIYKCCTSCHASSLEQGPQINDMAQLIVACGHCH